MGYICRVGLIFSYSQPTKVFWKLSLRRSRSWWKAPEPTEVDSGGEAADLRWGALRGVVNLAVNINPAKEAPVPDDTNASASDGDPKVSLQRWRVAGILADLLSWWRSEPPMEWSLEQSAFAARARECDSNALTDTDRTRDLNFAHDWANLEAKVSG